MAGTMDSCWMDVIDVIACDDGRSEQPGWQDRTGQGRVGQVSFVTSRWD